MGDPKYKHRRTEVVLPNEQMLQDWKEQAKKGKKTLSKFIVEKVNETMLAEVDDGLPSRSMLNHENIIHLKRIQELEDFLKRKDRDLDRMDRDLERYRAEAHLNQDFQGAREMHQKLVDLFISRKTILKIELLGLLQILPAEKKLIESINTQLELFKASGLIEDLSDKWSWQY